MLIISSNNLTQYDNVEDVENSVDNSKSIEELAKEVIAGKYGNGEERKKKLGNLYNEVQNRVNEIMGVSKELIKVGDKVEVLNAVQYNGQTFKTYYDVYDVIEVKDERVVIGIDQTVTCAINIKNIKKV